MKFMVIASLWVIICVGLYIGCQLFINKQYGDKDKLNKEADDVLEFNKNTSFENMKVKDVFKVILKNIYKLMWHNFEIRTENFKAVIPTSLVSFMFFVALSSATSAHNIFESLLGFAICFGVVGFFTDFTYMHHADKEGNDNECSNTNSGELEESEDNAPIDDLKPVSNKDSE